MAEKVPELLQNKLKHSQKGHHHLFNKQEEENKTKSYL